MTLCDNCDTESDVLRDHPTADQLLCDACYDKEPVDLIASGYEWTCPECGDLIHEIEAKEQVKHCERSYETAPPK